MAKRIEGKWTLEGTLDGITDVQRDDANNKITITLNKNNSSTRTFTVKYEDNGKCGKKTITQEGSGGGGGGDTFNLTIVNNTNKTFYTNGWGIFYTKPGGQYTSHVSGRFKLSTQASDSRSSYCNPITIAAGGSKTFTNIIEDDGFPQVYGREFEPDESGNPSFTFWLAAILTKDIKLSEGGEEIGRAAYNPGFVSTLIGGNTLQKGGSYTLTITNLPYPESYSENAQHEITWYNPQLEDISCA